MSFVDKCVIINNCVHLSLAKDDTI